eukprot:418041_1
MLRFFILLVFAAFINAQEEVDIIIMGAGMTGISAARFLFDAGVNNFVVIEAQDYIGGRTKTIPFGGTGLNAGGSWISGACLENNPSQCQYLGHLGSTNCPANNNNPMLQLADQIGLSYAKTDIHEWNHPPYPPFIYGPNSGDVWSNEVVAAEYAKWWIASTCRSSNNNLNYCQALNNCNWACNVNDNHNDLNNIEKTIQWIEFDLEFAFPINEYSAGWQTM